MKKWIEKVFLNKYLGKSQELLDQAKSLTYILLGLSILTGSLIFIVTARETVPVILLMIGVNVGLLFLIRAGYQQLAGAVAVTILSLIVAMIVFSMKFTQKYEVYQLTFFQFLIFFFTMLITTKSYHSVLVMVISTGTILYEYFFRAIPANLSGSLPEVDDYIIACAIICFAGILVIAINKRGRKLRNIIKMEAETNNQIARENKKIAEQLEKTNAFLTGIINKVRDISSVLNSSSVEMEAAAQEQSIASGEQTSGITKVSVTLQELSITAKQITTNVSELVLSSGQVITVLKDIEKALLQTNSQLDEVGKISIKNTEKIIELGRQSAVINEMVLLIKDVANKTNILSINASIEAAQHGQKGARFSVVASEIRELSRETLDSARNAEKAAQDIQKFFKSIENASKSESDRIIESGETLKKVSGNIRNIMTKINNNYSFTQKIDVSIKQQEDGSKQAADVIRQMEEIARQSTDIFRQTVIAIKDIVVLSKEMNTTINEYLQNK